VLDQSTAGNGCYGGHAAGRGDRVSSYYYYCSESDALHSTADKWCRNH
jgi:hypothetical protein